MPRTSPGNGTPLRWPKPNSEMYLCSRGAPSFIATLAVPMLDDLVMISRTDNEPYAWWSRSTLPAK